MTFESPEQELEFLRAETIRLATLLLDKRGADADHKRIADNGERMLATLASNADGEHSRRRFEAACKLPVNDDESVHYCRAIAADPPTCKKEGDIAGAEYWAKVDAALRCIKADALLAELERTSKP